MTLTEVMAELDRRIDEIIEQKPYNNVLHGILIGLQEARDLLNKTFEQSQ